jgi:hypothetical protein
VSTITSDVGDYDNSTHYLAFHVLTSADHWFQENELRTVLQEYSVWATLGAFDPDLPLFRRDITTHYISLGYKISTAPEWKTTIFQDLPSWLALLPTLQDPQINDKTIQEFCVVLSRIWAADVEQGQHLGYERPLAMSVIALANIWDGLDSVTITDIDSLIPIIKCTISTAFHGRVDNFWIHNVLSPRFQDIIMAHLGDSLARAGQKIKASTPSGQLDVIQDSKHTVYAVAELLVKLALTVNGELRNGAAHGRRAEEIEEITYWLKLRKGFYTDVEHLRQLFSKT